MLKIELSNKLKQQIATEKKCTVQTVYNACAYLQNSLLAKSIRKRAKELLHEESEKVVINPKIVEDDSKSVNP